MKLKSFITSLALLLSISIFAIPADQTPITIKQPNGKTLTFILQGDERISWGKTLDDYSLLRNENGNWVYSIINENGNMVASNFLACNKEERSQEETLFLNYIKKDIFFSQSQIETMLDRFNDPELDKKTLKDKESKTKKVKKKKWWRF